MAENLAKTAGMIKEIFSLIGHEFNVEEFNDRLLAQKGVYLLNCAGICPRYQFRQYIRGPYSSELADTYYKISEKNIAPEMCEIPEDIKNTLADILSRGIDFTEALATMLVVADVNKDIKGHELVDATIYVKPHLKMSTSRRHIHIWRKPNHSIH